MEISIPVDITLDFFSHPTCKKCPLKGTPLCDHVPTCRMIVALRGVELVPAPDREPKAIQYYTDIYALRRNRWRLADFDDYWYTRRQYEGHLVELRIRYSPKTGHYSKYYNVGEEDLKELYIKEFRKLEGIR